MAFTLLLLFVSLLALLAYFIYLQLHILITPVRHPVAGSPADLGLAYQEITLATADGLQLSGWHVAGTRPDAIVLVHGLNANRAAMLPEALVFARAGYHLLLFDLRGHGQSEAAGLTYGYREALDVQAAVDYLQAVPGIRHVGAVGTSLGGAAVARAAAADARLEAVVIESSYSSLPAAVEDAFDDFSALPRWPFGPLLIGLAQHRAGVRIEQVNSARDLAALSPRAVLIIHARDDRLFPAHHAETMYASAGEPKALWLIDSMDHANPVIGREAEYQARVIPFFERAFGGEK